jgi:outer membrane immunogenic protein
MDLSYERFPRRLVPLKQRAVRRNFLRHFRPCHMIRPLPLAPKFCRAALWCFASPNTTDTAILPRPPIKCAAALGGLYLGYNWQFAPTWLVGVEGDFTWTDLKQSVNAPLFRDAGSTVAIIPVVNSNLNFETDVKWLATLRGRVGYIFADNWLFYGTGGVAWARLDQSANASCPPPDVTNGCGFNGVGTQAPFSASTTRVGFVVGGGLEWQILPSTFGRWRARVEYLYYGFDATNTNSALFVAVPGGAPLTCANTPTCSA